MWGYVTIDTPDLYGGAAVTTKNIYRLQGTSTWTEVAGAATFNANPGSTYEIVFGIGDLNTEDDAEPYGPVATWTAPCSPYPIISREVVDDSLYTDLVNRAWDPEDGTVITSSATIDIDNGDVFNIEVEWQAAFEEDFGNRFCDKGNVLAIEYPTANYTNWKATDLNGNAYPTATCPTLESVAAGNVLKCYEVPTLKSNAMWNFYLVADCSGSGKDGDGGIFNVTANLYDVSRYVNNDVTPPSTPCGVEDEDGNELGATAADTLTIYVADD